METVLTILVLLVLVTVSGIINQFVSFMPMPLLQIGLGGCFAWSRVNGSHIVLDPVLFMLLFIPVLLFADGWRIPQREFIRLRGPIMTLALGLVLFTVVGLGYVVHWMLPDVPLPVAFALAAVLSPTDAVALSAITAKIEVPSRLMHILEGESLMNDASSLVALKFALIAAVTGVFSVWTATLDFIVMAVGGIGSGILVAWFVTWVRDKLASLYGEDPVMQAMLLILAPFAAYLLAEHFDFSGILAAVGAGMAMNYTDVRSSRYILTRMQAHSMWRIIEFVFNGIIFLLLGMQLPDIVTNAFTHSGTQHSPWAITGYALMIMCSLFILRYVWIRVACLFGNMVLRWRGQSVENFPHYIMVAASLAGVRGAITLAAALSLPLVLQAGQPFPERNLIIFIAAAVILISLVMASVCLPSLLKGRQLPGETPHDREVRMARRAAAQAAIRAVEKAQRQYVQKLQAEHSQDEGREVTQLTESSARLMNYYQQQVATLSRQEEVQQTGDHVRQYERVIRLAGLHAERAELYRLRRAHLINDETLREIVAEIDLIETAVMHAKNR